MKNTSGLWRGGSPGRKKGARDRVPRSFKASIRDVFEAIATEDPEMIKTAIERGLRGRPRESFPYVQLAAHYIDGKPEDVVRLKGQSMPAPYVIVPPPGVVLPKADEDE